MIDYSRNYLAISDDVQTKIADQRLLIVGLGIGSVLAELAVRTGFRNLTIVDHDQVSLSNLNRQNYSLKDIDVSKAKACEQRLLAIDPEIKLQTFDQFADVAFLQSQIPQHDFIINTIDFDAAEFQICTKISQKFNKTELFPINLGFGCAVFVFSGSGSWNALFPDEDTQKLKRNILEFLFNSGRLSPFLKSKMLDYFKMTDKTYDPQLAISSYLVSSLSVSILLRIASGEQPNVFPNFYFLDARID